MIITNKKGVAFFALIGPYMLILFFLTLILLINFDKGSVEDAQRYGSLVSAIDNSSMKFESLRFFIGDNLDNDIEKYRFEIFNSVKKAEIFCIENGMTTWFDENQLENEKNCILKLNENYEDDLGEKFKGRIEKYLNPSISNLGFEYEVNYVYDDELKKYDFKVIIIDKFEKTGAGSFEKKEVFEKEISIKEEIEVLEFFSNEINLLNLKKSITSCGLEKDENCLSEVIMKVLGSDFLEIYDVVSTYESFESNERFNVLIELNSKDFESKSTEMLLIYFS